MGGCCSKRVPAQQAQPVQKKVSKSKSKSSIRISLDPAAKLHRLKTMEVFVLDNSLRETSVAQVRGHVLKDKLEIAEAVIGTGVSEKIVASFGNLTRVDDLYLQQLLMEGTIDESMYAFSEMWDPGNDGIHHVPSREIPLGLKKIKTYGIPNVILEISLESGCSTWDEFPLESIFDLVVLRLEYIKAEISPQSRVLINYRDACVAWNNPEAHKRMFGLTKLLARLPAKVRPFGLIFEEPMGTVFPWEVSELVNKIRNTMISNGWVDGQWLIHVHKGYGLADAIVLEALACGATGIWCAICCEGAMVGHASSLVTLTNLARLGNTYVQSKFNFPKLRQAAIKITEVSTNMPPHANQEIYGARALDICFDSAGMMGGYDKDKFSAAKLFNEDASVRVTTFTTAQMFVDRLKQVFGANKLIPISIGEKMREQLHADLNSGDEFDYQTPVGLFDLYRRAGGLAYVDEFSSTVLSLPERIVERHRLIEEFRVAFDDACTDGNAFDELMKVVDLDDDGLVEWSAMCTYAQWAITEYPIESEKWTLDDLLDRIFHDHIMVRTMQLRREEHPDESDADMPSWMVGSSSITGLSVLPAPVSAMVGMTTSHPAWPIRMPFMPDPGEKEIKKVAKRKSKVEEEEIIVNPNLSLRPLSGWMASFAECRIFPLDDGSHVPIVLTYYPTDIAPLCNHCLAVAGHTLQAIDTISKEVKATLKPITNIWSLKASHDGNRVTAGHFGGHVTQYELVNDGSEWRPKWTSKPHDKGYIYGLHIIPSHSLLCSGSDSENRVAVLKLDEGGIKTHITLPNREFVIRICGLGGDVIGVGSSGKVHIVSVFNRTVLQTIVVGDGLVYGLGATLSATFNDNTVHKIEISTGSHMWRYKCVDKVLGLTLTQDSVVVGVAHSFALHLSLEDGTVASRLPKALGAVYGLIAN